MPLAIDDMPKPDRESITPEVLPVEPVAQGNISGGSGVSIPVETDDGDVALMPALDDAGKLLTRDEAQALYRQSGQQDRKSVV